MADVDSKLNTEYRALVERLRAPAFPRAMDGSASDPAAHAAECFPLFHC
jgi:hypothetical protein